MAHRRLIRRMALTVALTCTLLTGWASPSNAQSWTPLVNLSPDFAGTMMLLTDGSVMVQGYPGTVGTTRFDGSNWMRLMPDATGSYINGTWSNLASMSTPRLYFASRNLPSGKVWLLGGEYAGPGLPATWSATGEVYDPLTNTWSPIASYPPEPGCPLMNGVRPPACFGDDPSMLLPGGLILAGDLLTNTPHIYNIATNTWSPAGSKVYADSSDEESWVKLPDGTILTYDIFQSVNTGGQYAEKYDPVTNTWSSVSPSDGTAFGFIPQLSSAAVGFELGPLVRLQDGRILALGATGHTALYTVSSNTWTAGPDIMGTLSCGLRIFGVDDGPAAVLPSGHVLFAADAGPNLITSSGNTTTGSMIITNIPSTSCFTVGWAVAGTGIPSGARITSVDSATQIHISVNATATNTGIALRFGGVFSNPTQLFDFDPAADTISPVSPALADPNLPGSPAFPTRMLILPTGQVLFNDNGRRLYVYTPAGAADPVVRPSITSITDSAGVFTLGGKQLNGQSAGSVYGDDVESDENFPIVRLRSASGQMFYARTTNWSTTGVATGSTPETVDFTLPSTLTTPGTYSVQDVGAGIGSFPVYVNITAAEIAGQ
jgi:Kelch motif protein